MVDLTKLHPRLYVVARRAVDGVPRRDTCDELRVSLTTIERMRREVYECFGVKDMYELAAIVADAKLKPPRKHASERVRLGMSMRAEEMSALDRVLTAAELGRDVRVMLRDPMYRRARSVLTRAAMAARRKMATAEVDNAAQ